MIVNIIVLVIITALTTVVVIINVATEANLTQKNFYDIIYL